MLHGGVERLPGPDGGSRQLGASGAGLFEDCGDGFPRSHVHHEQLRSVPYLGSQGTPRLRPCLGIGLPISDS